MKIGILSDIHNNVIALDAVLKKFDKEDCKQVICAGDIIGIGPYPEETVQRVMSIPNLIAVRGNHEKYLLEGMPSQYPNDEKMGYEEMKHHKWEHSRLSESSIDFLRNLPYRADLTALNKKITVLHYSMNKNHQFIYASSPTENDLSNMFQGEDQDIVIYGHNHTSNLCHRQGKWFINSGSVGCPAKERNIARAAILEISEDGHICVQSIEVDYDVSKVLADIDRLNYPDAPAIKKFFFGCSSAVSKP